MNALLQCLATAEGIVEAVDAFPPCRIQTFFAHIFQKLVLKDTHPSAQVDEDQTAPHGPKPITARPLLNYLQQSFDMNMYEQHDLHEILLMLLSTIHTNVGQPVPKRMSTQNTSMWSRLEAKCRERFYADNEWKSSFVTENLSGQIIKQIVCGHCDDVNHNYETFTTLNLDIQNHAQDESLESSIEHFFKPRIITDWTCQKCKMCVPSEQHTFMWRLPKTLLVCLSRFQVSRNRRGMSKNAKMVGIPDILNIPNKHIIQPPHAPRQSPPRYKFRSAACHHGHMNYGHYIALVQDKDTNGWVRIDDDVIHHYSTEDMDNHRDEESGHYLLDNAYLIVYNVLS